ncbi:MAG: DNA primase [Muribaculaceae bacterium]|nr:DNA primase [Muribaculaceae bacterium]
MGLIDRETVQRILDAADIVDVVSDFVKLRRSGANYIGLCPFHNERTPSFSVNKARNICKCFSCGKGGGPVNFIMEHEQMTYAEALRYLARKYNIEIVERELSDAERQAQSHREALMAVNAFALEHFKKRLREHADGQEIAIPYLRHRGLSDAMIERFHIGYALERSNDLLDAARTAGYRDENLIETGLESRSERDGRLHDRFRGRVIFPIHSLSGRVVGFGGRTMRTDKDVAKYVNSPESEIYHKKHELYGLYQARSAIARRNKCIMVEGYLDVISMHQAGVENVVASSGTSLTEEQVRVIHRFTENVTLIYDADAAGIKASLRGINLLLAEKMRVKVLALPPGDDPDSFAQSHSSSEVEQYLADNEVDIIAFMVSKLMAGVDPKDPTARAQIVNEVLKTVAYVDEPVMRQEYIAQCSRLLGIPEEVLVPQLNIFITRRLDDQFKERQREKARASVQQAARTSPATDTSGADSQPGSISGANAVDGTGEPSGGAPAVTVPAEVNLVDEPLLNLDTNRLKPYETMLAQYIVRYGLLAIPVKVERPADDASAVPQTEVVHMLVYDYIKSSLEEDGQDFTYGPYKALDVAFSAIRNDLWPAEHDRRLAELEVECADRIEAAREEVRQRAMSMADLEKQEAIIQQEVAEYHEAAIEEFDMVFGQAQLINSADSDVRAVTNELLPERYTLSRIYEKGRRIESEQDQLGILVPRAVRELRSAIVSGIIKDLSDRLATLAPEDTDQMLEIMAMINEWKRFQSEMSRQLGKRIIIPRMR